MKLTTIATTLCLVAAACAAEDDGSIDEAKLATFRAAIPSKARLSAPAPKASTAAALGDPALYPTTSWPLVEGINGAVGSMIDLLEAIVALPPTVYNSDTDEFVWGPWPSDDGVGYVAAYIRDTHGTEDFRYQYALLRGASNDLATLTPVVWGGATPDPDNDDHGVGVTLWDMEADRAFREANDPNFDPAAGDRGRFAALYGAGDDPDAPENEMAFVVAVFRDWVPADEPAAEPTDLDYFYGRYITAEHTIDFIDYEVDIDVSDPADGIAEAVGVRMAFLDEGTGRAEADAANGSLAANQTVEAVECWDTSLSETYLRFDLIESGSVAQSISDGDLANCGLFQASLDDLDIPSLQDVDADLMAALDDVATNGVTAP
ncbi:MAG: hypothetical protein D6689_19010 [Deltaproteobacteria bacterium]|nr:MAG: hypothetical protein D6689_19010 [Deltaproteobacteria bacterium]